MKPLFTALAVGLAVVATAGQRSHRHMRMIEANPIKVFVDGQQVIFDDTQPTAIKGRIMVPLRGIFEKIGAFVEYDAANHIVTAKRGNESVELRLGDKVANRNGALIIMDVPANLVGGSTMVPLRFVTDSLHVKLDYDGPTNTVNISTTDMEFGPAGEKHRGGGSDGGR